MIEVKIHKSGPLLLFSLARRILNIIRPRHISVLPNGKLQRPSFVIDHNHSVHEHFSDPEFTSLVSSNDPVNNIIFTLIFHDFRIGLIFSKVKSKAQFTRFS